MATCDKEECIVLIGLTSDRPNPACPSNVCKGMAIVSIRMIHSDLRVVPEWTCMDHDVIPVSFQTLIRTVYIPIQCSQL